MEKIWVVKHDIASFVVADQPLAGIATAVLGILQVFGEVFDVVSELAVSRHVHVEPGDSFLGRKVHVLLHDDNRFFYYQHRSQYQFPVVKHVAVGYFQSVACGRSCSGAKRFVFTFLIVFSGY